MVLSNRLIPAALHLSSAAMRRRWRWVLPCARGGRSACSFDIAEALGSLFPGRRLLPALGGTRHVGLGILRLRIDWCRVLSGAPGGRQPGDLGAGRVLFSGQPAIIVSGSIKPFCHFGL